MALESATYVDDLVATNPASSDDAVQGDDHLRLIKAALKATFPTASKAFYFPTYEEIATDETVAAADDNNWYVVDTSGGNVAVTLPVTLGTAKKGFRVFVQRGASASNTLTIAPASGTINGAASLTIAAAYFTIMCVWTGSTWVAARFGGNTETGALALLDTVNTAQIENDAVTAAKVLDGTLTAAKLATAVQTSLAYVDDSLGRGAGQLQYVSATQIKLAPYNGNLFSFPSGTTLELGSSGLTADYNNATINGTTGQTLASTTLYFVYVYNNSGSLAIDFSTTAYGTSTANGVMVKSTDATRVLVGMVYTDGSGQFQNSATNRCVASWNNRQWKRVKGTPAANRTITGASWQLINGGEDVAFFLSWGDAIWASSQVAITALANGEIAAVSPGLDSSSSVLYPAVLTGTSATGASDINSITGSGMFETGTVGLHYVTTLASSPSGDSFNVAYTYSSISGMVNI